MNTPGSSLAAIAAVAFTGGVARGEPEPAPPRDEGLAMNLSIAGSIGAGVLVGLAGDHTSAAWRPAAIELIGAVIAPSFGHAYGGDYLSLGLGLRAVGAGLAALGVYDWSRPSHGDSSTIEFSPVGGSLILGGLAALAAGTIYDLATTRRTVRRWNHEHATVVPMAMATASGPAAGIGLGGCF